MFRNAHRRLRAGYRSRVDLAGVAHDARFGLRLLLKHPAPASIVIGGLGVAIGVATAVFSLVNAAFLQPYTIDDPASVMTVARVDAQRHTSGDTWPYSQFLQMRRAVDTGRLEASMSERVNIGLTAALDPSTQRDAIVVSGGYLSMLGATPLVGRLLQPFDDIASAAPVAIISYRLWQTMLGGQPSVIGRTVRLNGAPVTIVGVLPAHFKAPVRTQPSIWISFETASRVIEGEPFDASTTAPVAVLLRLSTLHAAAATQGRLTAIVNQEPAPNGHVAARLSIVSSSTAGDGDVEAVVTSLCVLGVLGLILVVACTNAATLLMAAAITRRREIGVRLALGASRRRVVRQLVSEGVVLGGVAGGLGWIVALWFAPVIGAVVQLSPEIDVTPDARVFLFAISVALLCGVLSGLAPARHGTRGHLVSALQADSGSRGASMPGRFRTWLVAVQAGVSMLFLGVAALLARSAIASAHVESGFDASHLLAAEFNLPAANFDARTYAQTALAAARNAPGIEAVARIRYPPFGNVRNSVRVSYEARSVRLYANDIDENYLSTAGIRLVRGRAFAAGDDASDGAVMLITTRAARALFDAADPVGRRVSVTSTDGTTRDSIVLGVVTDSIVEQLPRSDVAGAIYRPLTLNVTAPAGLVVRTASPLVSRHVVENVLRRIDPRVQVTTWLVQQGIDAEHAGADTLASIAVSVAAIALLLAGFGLYGLTTFVSRQRVGEVSVRLALGASARNILTMLVADSLRPVVIGLCAGLAALLLIANVLARPFAIDPFDPIALGGTMAALVIGALVAVIAPAYRASRTDPAALMREG
jgi:putative ABC transport system permease protein